MKKISKLSVVLVLVFSMLCSMIGSFSAAAAESGDLGGYYVLAMDSAENYAANIGSFPSNNCYIESGFEELSGASYFSAKSNGQRRTIINNAFKNGYKYAKMVWKVDDIKVDTSKSVYFYAYKTSGNPNYDLIKTENQPASGEWRTSTFNCVNVANINNVLEMDCAAGSSGEWGHVYIKYIAFFETEAGMNAYDRKMLSATVDGNAAEVDEINKTITYNVPYGKKFDESEGHNIVITPVTGAAAEKTESGYDVTYDGVTTSYAFAINYAEVTSPYIYSFETKEQYDANSGNFITNTGQYPKSVSYNETAGAAELTSQQWKNSLIYGIKVNDGPLLAEYDYVKIRYRISECYQPTINPTVVYAGVYVGNAWTYSQDTPANAPQLPSEQWYDVIMPIPLGNYGNSAINQIYLQYNYNIPKGTWTNLQVKYVGLFESYEAAAKFDYNAGLIDEFKIGENVGKVNDAERTIECYAPKGDVSQLIPTVTFKKGAKADSGKIESDGTSNLFKVKKADGTIVKYKVILKQNIENLAVNGDAEGENPIGDEGWKCGTQSSGMSVATDEQGNKYILFETSDKKSPFWYNANLLKGHKYLLMFDAKTDVAQNLWSGAIGGTFYMDDVWRTYSKVYSPSGDESSLTIYTSAAVSGCKVYLDNLKIYDITNLAEAEISIPHQFTAESETGIINKNMIYDIPGSALKINRNSYPIPSERYAAAGEGLTQTAEGYSCILSGKDMKIKVEIKDKMDWNTDGSGNATLISAENKGDAVLYKAEYANGALSAAARENVSLSAPLNVSGAAGKKLFVWGKNDSLIPLAESYKVMPSAAIYVCSDKGGAVWGDRRDIQGWGYYLPELADNNATIINKASDWAYQTAEAFKADAVYSDVINSLKSGDWMIISFGRKDAEKSSVDAYKTAVKSMIDAAKEKGANAVIVADMGMTQKFVEASKATASECGVSLIDMTDVPETGFYSDSTNLNYIGARYAADTLAELIKKSDSDLKFYLK